MLKLINYRLHRPGQNYDSLYEAIKGISGTYWHNTTSSWLVETSLTPQQVYNHLKPHFDANDELVIFTVTTEWWGQLQPDDLKWLQARL